MELLAEKVAFYLQLRGQREAKKEVLVDLACDLFDPVMDRASAKRVLEELVHPCNILVPMTWTDRLGFGHLRYQEYLAARELRNNRGIAIAPLLSSSWWKGVLVLFAQMNESLEWIVEELAEFPIDPMTRDNVLAMIDAGPTRGRDELRAFVTEKSELDETIEDHLRDLR